VAVVGGGISGILSAAILARRGHAVTLVDEASALGGLLGSVRHGGHWFDYGTHVPQELGHEGLDDLLFEVLDPDEWHRIDVLRAGHVFAGALTPTSPFPAVATLGRPVHDQAMVELLERIDPGDGHRTAEQELGATFGPTITDRVFRPAVERFYDRPLDVLGSGAHRVLFNRVVASDAATTRVLKSALPHLDTTLAFHHPEDGPNRAAWYPHHGGCGRWVEELSRHHLGAVDLRLGALVDKVALCDDGVASLLFDDGRELEIDHVVWTLPPARFLAAAGVDLPPGGSRPELLPVALHHLVLDRPLTTDAHYVTVLDPGRLTNRVTLYPNLRRGGPVSCTVERVGPQPGTDAPALVEELSELGITDPATQVVQATEQVITAGFPVPTPATVAAAEVLTAAAEAAVANAHFLGRTTGRAFFMAEVLGQCWDALA
jgi:protoporphyrinogen oxidase